MSMDSHAYAFLTDGNSWIVCRTVVESELGILGMKETFIVQLDPRVNLQPPCGGTEVAGMVGVEVTVLAEALASLGTNQATQRPVGNLDTGLTIGDTKVRVIALRYY